MVNRQKILGLLGLAMRAGEVCFGTDSCIEFMQNKKIKLILIAEDAAERTKRNFTFLCERNKIPIKLFGTIEENSKAIGKKNKAVIGIKNSNFANQLEKMINDGGELIG